MTNFDQAKLDEHMARMRAARDAQRKVWATEKWTDSLGPERKIVREFEITETSRGYVIEWQNPMYTATIDNARLAQLLGSAYPTLFNGYVKYDKRPAQEEEYGGILTYVPVHGGITYAEQWADGFVYGFDTLHANDENNPSLRDLDWLERAVRQMAACISIAAQFESAYQAAAEFPAARAKVLDEYHETLSVSGLGEFELTDNFGAMINVLTGKL